MDRRVLLALACAPLVACGAIIGVVDREYAPDAGIDAGGGADATLDAPGADAPEAQTTDAPQTADAPADDASRADSGVDADARAEDAPSDAPDASDAGEDACAASGSGCSVANPPLCHSAQGTYACDNGALVCALPVLGLGTACGSDGGHCNGSGQCL